ncbi:MAG: hypothetical protein QM766_26320 [Burkholderiaceae bacterium]
MILSLSTTHHPASDLGFLLMKHPDRVHETALPYYGRALIFFPESHEARCEAVLMLDIDPVGLVRGGGGAGGEGMLDHYVNDRPYAASSLLAVALNRVFRTAMNGTSRDRPALAGKRRLALREFALGHESLARFVDRAPLRRVHECVFAVLALESEPIDPRL